MRVCKRGKNGVLLINITASFVIGKKFEVIADSLTHSINRGVVRNSEGKVEICAKATFTGGSKSMISRDKKLISESSLTVCTTKPVHTICNYKLTHMKGMEKNGKKRKRQQEIDNVSGSNQVESERPLSQAPEWINPEYEKILERYYACLDEKYASRPQDKPSEWDPRDEECWAMACGGIKKGKVIGVSNHVVLEDLGNKLKRRVLKADVVQSTEFIDNTIQKTIDAISAKFYEEHQSHEAQFSIERQAYQAQILELRGETLQNRKVMQDLMAKLSPLTRDGDGTDGDSG